MADTPPFTHFDFASTAMSVHSTVDAAFASIPAGKRGAFLGRVTEGPSGKQVEVSLAGRLGDHWELATGGAWDGNRHHDPTAEIGVIGFW